MVFYRNSDSDDPFHHIYASPEWLRDYDNPVLPFPLIVDLEVTNHCNLECIFCQRRTSSAPQGRMAFSHFRKVVDECAERRAPIRISGWGEPLVHTQIVDFIRYASEKGVLTKIYTNGLLLTESTMQGLIGAGLGELQFSMQGLNAAQYADNRRKGDYEKLAGIIRMAARQRDPSGSTGPFLGIVTSVLRREQEEGDVDGFRDEWLQYVDKVAVDMTNLNFVGEDAEVAPLIGQHLIEPVHVRCVDVFLKIHIAWDGSLDICSQDAHHYPEYVLGSIDDLRIEEAWRSEKFEHHRNLVGRALQHDELPLCRNCFPATDKYDYLKEELASQAADG